MGDNLSWKDRSWCMSQIRSRSMKPELIVRSMVHRLGYRFRLHRRDMAGKPDLVLPRHRAVIFVNGCFWHWHPDPNCPIAGLPKSNLGYWEPKLARTRIRDQEHMASLEAGWRLPRFSPNSFLSFLLHNFGASAFARNAYGLALLMGEFSDSFLTVVAAMVMLYGLRGTLLQ